MPIVTETFEEFVERHGGNSVASKERNVWLLPDGASFVNYGFGPALHEPPADPLKRLQAVRKYYATKFDRAATAFGNLKSALLGHGRAFEWDATEFGPAPHDDGKGALLKLREIALKYRAEVAKLDEQIEATPEMRAQRQREAQFQAAMAERERREMDRLTEIDSINL